MDASRFIASKLKFKSRLAIGATAVSAFIIVLSISILSGFKTEIYKSISKICAEVCLYAPDSNTFDEEVITTLEKNKRIESVRAAVVEPSILKSGESLEGVIFHSDESISEKLHIKITESLARTLSAHKNDTLTAYFIGDKMKVRNFVVEDIIEDPALIDKNAQIAFAGISDLQRVKGLHTGEAQKELLNMVLRRASRSRFGVMISSFPAQCIAQQPWSSERMKTIFGFFSITFYTLHIALKIGLSLTLLKS